MLLGTSSKRNVGPYRWNNVPAKPNTYYTFSGILASDGAKDSGATVLAPYLRFMDENGNRISEKGLNLRIPFADKEFEHTVLSPAGTVSLEAFVTFDAPVGKRPDLQYSKLNLVEWPAAQPWAPSPLDGLADRFEKMGGVAGSNLLPGNTTPALRIDGGDDSKSHLTAQRLGYVYGKECLPKESIIVRPNKGDVIMQKVLVRVSEGAELDDRITFTFFDFTSGHYQHHVVPSTVTQLGNNQYLVSATWTVPKDGVNLRLLDMINFGLSSVSGNSSDAWIEVDAPFAGLVQSGGVTATSLLQPVTWTGKWGATLTNGISNHSKMADNTNYYDDVKYNISSFAPSTRYRLSFVAWGSGSIQTLVYPGAALSENGKSGDGQKTWTLTDKPTEYTYEFDSLATLYGDNQKTLLFRIPGDKQAVDFSLDTNSVVLEKVGGVSKAFDLPYINLIKVSSPTQTIFEQGTLSNTGLDHWNANSSGNGQLKRIELDDSFRARHGYTVIGNAVNTNRDASIRVPITPNSGKYTLSVKFKLVPDTPGSATPLARIWSDSKMEWIGYGDRTKIGTWVTNSWQIDTANWGPAAYETLQIGLNGSGSIYIAEPQLEKGTVAHDYMPSPYDNSLDWRY